MKKLLTLLLALSLAMTAAACSSSDTADASAATDSSAAAETSAAADSSAAADTAETQDAEMQYITPDEVKNVLQTGDDSYLLIDVRKAADHETSHILNAISIDMDAAKEGDVEAGITAMKTGLQEATGTENGGDKKMVLICYSGKSYAQAATNSLASIGANMSNVYTLEGGMEAWTAAYPDILCANETTADVEMQYITADELKAAIDSQDDSYLLVDVRKAADYETSHIPGSISIDMDAAKEGDMEKGLHNMKLGLLQNTGSVDGGDKKLVLICYSGKSYAQAATNALAAYGVDTASRVLTLEGGFTNWSEAYPDVVE